MNETKDTDLSWLPEGGKGIERRLAKTWEQKRLDEISKKLLRDPVYRAMGQGLREAMIAERVIGLMYSMDHPDMPKERFLKLYDMLRVMLLEGYEELDLNRWENER